MKSKLKLKWKTSSKMCVHNFYGWEICCTFLVSFFLAWCMAMEPDGYRLIVHTEREGRESGSRWGPVKWQSCESVKTALGCVETGFVDSVRRWKCLKNGILMQRIYNLRLSMSPNGTRRGTKGRSAEELCRADNFIYKLWYFRFLSPVKTGKIAATPAAHKHKFRGTRKESRRVLKRT